MARGFPQRGVHSTNAQCLAALQASGEGQVLSKCFRMDALFLILSHLPPVNFIVLTLRKRGWNWVRLQEEAASVEWKEKCEECALLWGLLWRKSEFLSFSPLSTQLSLG